MLSGTLGKKVLAFASLWWIILVSPWGLAFEACNLAENSCWDSQSRPAAPAYPSSSSAVRINPSAVPLDDRFGIEAIGYKNEWDLGIVKGNGRIGAAISPTNGEETFFGSPGFEFNSEILERKNEKRKFKSQKYNFATAMSLYNNKKSGLERIQANLGLIGKYNKLTQEVTPGVGFSAILGPLTLGYARASDKHVLDPEPYGLDEPIELFPYQTETYAAGLFLTSLAIDYSRQTITAEGELPIYVNLTTLSIFLKKKWILTIASRVEDSERPDYDDEKRILVPRTIKQELFGGVQYAINKTIMVGGYLNYYLLNDISFGLTVFF